MLRGVSYDTHKYSIHVTFHVEQVFLLVQCMLRALLPSYTLWRRSISWLWRQMVQLCTIPLSALAAIRAVPRNVFLPLSLTKVRVFIRCCVEWWFDSVPMREERVTTNGSLLERGMGWTMKFLSRRIQMLGHRGVINFVCLRNGKYYADNLRKTQFKLANCGGARDRKRCCFLGQFSFYFLCEQDYTL
jgi:hypothetical protein